MVLDVVCNGIFIFIVGDFGDIDVNMDWIEKVIKVNDVIVK